MYTIEPVFPTPLYKTQIQISKDYKNNLENYFKKFEYVKHRSGTWGTNPTIHNLIDGEIFSNLKKQFEEHLTTYTKEVFKYDVDSYITQSWINLNPPGSYHSLHYHTNSLLSGVYYFDIPDGVPGIAFENVRKHCVEIFPTEWNQYNVHCWNVSVAEGDLILFPSHMYHEVMENTSSETRVSIAFNSFLKGKIGNKDYVNEMEL
jgi:uncharacterized protein (TIGR02466 family)